MPYSDDLSVRDARAEYFARSGFASDGGYGDRWVRLKVNGVTAFAFPNTASRLRSVRLHDIHHVLTGYDTTWAGEAEIAAWELASGCRHHYAAWVLNLGAMAIGALLWPRRVLAAFRRGRKCGNLYRGEYSDELLGLTVGELRRRIELGPQA
jgi:ubiquinone biosynthesis protein Coq4